MRSNPQNETGIPRQIAAKRPRALKPGFGLVGPGRQDSWEAARSDRGMAIFQRPSTQYYFSMNSPKGGIFSLTTYMPIHTVNDVYWS